MRAASDSWGPKRRSITRWGLLFATGCGVGLLGAFVTWTSRSLTSLKFDLVNDLIGMEQKGSVGNGTAFAVFIAVSIVYGALASIPASYIEPAATGSGIPEVKTVLNGVAMPKVSE